MMMFTMCIYAQEQTVSDSLKARRARKIVDTRPSFPGGEEMMKRYLIWNLTLAIPRRPKMPAY